MQWELYGISESLFTQDCIYYILSYTYPSKKVISFIIIHEENIKEITTGKELAYLGGEVQFSNKIPIHTNSYFHIPQTKSASSPKYLMQNPTYLHFIFSLNIIHVFKIIKEYKRFHGDI
jgi:hypothetical protein